MKGQNTLRLNHATAEEAFQEYLNKRASAGSEVLVQSITYRDANFDVKVVPLLKGATPNG